MGAQRAAAGARARLVNDAAACTAQHRPGLGASGLLKPALPAAGHPTHSLTLLPHHPPTLLHLQDIEERLGVRIRFFVGYPHKRSDRVEQELQAEMREVRAAQFILRLDQWDRLAGAQ